VIELPINFAIGFGLFPIELLVKLKQDLWDTNFVCWNFEVLGDFGITDNYVAVFLCWWQVFVLVELMLSLLGVWLMVLRGKRVEFWFLGNYWWLRNVWPDNGFVVLEKMKQWFSLFNWINDMGRMQEVVHMVKDIPIFFVLWLEVHIFAFCNLITQT